MLVEWARDIQEWKGLTTTTIRDGGTYLRSLLSPTDSCWNPVESRQSGGIQAIRWNPGNSQNSGGINFGRGTCQIDEKIPAEF
jgi:hypothetical protein